MGGGRGGVLRAGTTGPTNGSNLTYKDSRANALV